MTACPDRLPDAVPNPIAATRVPIDLGERSYDILVGRGLLGETASFDGLPAAADALVVTNDVVAPLHGARLAAAIAPLHRRVLSVQLADGEAHKDWASLMPIFDRLVESSCDRRTRLYALGGGVVGDMTGFAAACYMRGVPFVQVPTTLLAQVDSSVGGKTAINHPLGKNMIGAFHQPLRVVCDLDALATLPPREISAGLAEIVKIAVVADAAFLGWIEARVDALRALEPEALAHAVRRACELKASVVSRDEREAGLREILNFGHTFGHAIETGLGHGAWLHGEAVGCGMVLAAELSARLGRTPAQTVGRLERLVARCGLPTRAPAMPAGRWLELMRGDKKARAGEIRFVVVDGIGRAAVVPAPDALVADVVAHRSAAPA